MPTVVIPIKGFGAAKGRLGAALDGPGRAGLAREMAATVIAAAGPLPVLVVTDDDEVAAFAAERGAAVHRQVEDGLNAAVTEATAHLAAAGVDRAVVAHADLPRATTFAHLLDGDVVIVPDRHRDGTNVLVVPTGVGFTFAYGPGSFAAHVAEAERLGLGVEVVDDPDLAWDVDTPEDLRARRGA